MHHYQSENNRLPDYSKKEILEELDNILSSDLFSRSTVLSNFLKFIVEETILENTEGLKEYTIAVGALGKADDFNPQIDAIVRINAGRLRRLLNEYYLSVGANNLIKIELVKGTYVPLFRSNIIIQPKERNKEYNNPVLYSRSKLTLAVLPFSNLCPDNDFEFFVNGFGEELTRVFSNFEEIAVIAHYSTRKYANKPDDIRVIGSDLGVHYIITGSVKRTSKDIRVNVALVKGISGTQVWSQSYNHELNIDNLIEIQDQIIKKVCSLLGGYYGLIIHEDSKTHRATIRSIESFDAALWNYYFHINYSEETYFQTRYALEEALKLNPDYATGLAMLAELYLAAFINGYPTVEDPVKVSYDLTKRAIKIDPQCQRAHQEYAWVLLHLKRKEEAVKAMEQCLAINPSSVSSIGAIGFGMACAGEYDRAELLLIESLNLNPHCPWWFHLGFFLVYYHKQQYAKALEYANKIETLDTFLDPVIKIAAKVKLGLHDEAREEVRILTEVFPEVIANLEVSLNMFLLDKSIIAEIIKDVKNAENNPE